jgi:hypothetical protein
MIVCYNLLVVIFYKFRIKVNLFYLGNLFVILENIIKQHIEINYNKKVRM